MSKETCNSAKKPMKETYLLAWKMKSRAVASVLARCSATMSKETCNFAKRPIKKTYLLG